jgi:serine protease Do
VRIQQVTDDIAESLGLKPVRGALVAGSRTTRARRSPAGIEAGDVIVKFDGKDIKEMRDLPKIVGETRSARTCRSSSSARARKRRRPFASAAGGYAG